MTDWHIFNPPGICWHCGEPTTHMVECPPGQVDARPARAYICQTLALRIRQDQLACGDPVTVREVA